MIVWLNLQLKIAKTDKPFVHLKKKKDDDDVLKKNDAAILTEIVSTPILKAE